MEGQQSLKYTESKDFKTEQNSEDRIETITNDLTKKYNNGTINEYLEYLNSLNLEELPNELLENELDRLTDMLEFFVDEVYIIDDDSIKKFFWRLFIEILSIINLFVSSNLFWGAKVLLPIVLVINSCSFISIIGKILKEERIFKEGKHDNISKIQSNISKLKNVLALKKSLNSITNSKKDAEEKVKSHINEIGKNELIARITEIESKILLLPKEEEKDFQEKLQEALESYKEDLRSFEASGITLVLKNKLTCLKELNEKLNSLDSELNNRNMFVSEEQFMSQLEVDVTKYIEEIPDASNKASNILLLMQNLGSSLETTEDILKGIKIKDAFAKCFWETIKCANDDEIESILKYLRPEFWDRIILKGEKKLDELEQTTEVIGRRTILFQYKSSPDYSAEKYLKELIYYVKYFQTKNKTRNRTITTFVHM